MTNRVVPTEDAEQAAVVMWAQYMSGAYPELRMLFAIPNGGKRHISTAVRLQQTGVKAGVPDLMLPVPRGDYHGLFVELKRTKGGAVSAAQKSWHNQLAMQGYRVQVCRGAAAAIDCISQYLGVGT